MTKVSDIPVFVRGAGRITLALKSTLTASRRGMSSRRGAMGPSAWHDGFLNGDVDVRCSDRQSLAELGYRASPHPSIPVEKITGCCMVSNLLTSEAVSMLRAVCADLEARAGDSDWIISRRTRGLTELSSFINDLMNSRAFLLAVSRIAGVPLVPYPMINARSQVNYFYPVKRSGQEAQVGMWHTDGTNYVLNMLLSDRSDYEGGEFLYFDGTATEFDSERLDPLRIKPAPMQKPGDAMFIYGSRLFHGVRPVTAGKRMSIVLSFHCPYTREDSNTFWHLASDDGVPATIGNWITLKRSLREDAERQYEALGIHPITFLDLQSPEVQQTQA